MRLVPSANNPTSFTHLKTAGAPSAPGLHDALRHGVGPTPSHLHGAESSNVDVPVSRHPLESRLKAWQSTQDALRMETLRKTSASPSPSAAAWRPRLSARDRGGPLPSAARAGKNSLHEDILSGRDTSVDWEDVFTGEEQRSAVPIHDEMERKLKM
ncbi:hypothetical protein G7054_g9497 [Neopestalotiopsis clavispora]|nr:hypothetical protein G7054_g9497 [Neopestalotiopsis clavispora]